MKNAILACFLHLVTITATAQSIGINNTGAAPHPSAMLDVNSNNKGLLLPRVSLQSKFDSITISHPAVSLIVFNTNKNMPQGMGYYVWNGISWDLFLSLGNQLKKGGTRLTITVDGDERECWVSIPAGYDSSTATPMHIMLHGTSGDGQKFYNISGWKELGEEENIITVFPSSWRYRIITQGDTSITTKWNTPPDAEWTFAPGQTGRDDIKFLRMMIDTLKSQFHIDTNRIYLSGFSNGGQMAAKCSIEMSDILAAVCSNAGGFYLDTTYTPLRILPVLYQVGNRDYGPGNTGTAVPLSTYHLTLHNLFTLQPARFNFNQLHRVIGNFGIDSTTQVIAGDTNSAVTASFTGPAGPLNRLRMIFVKDLAHQYPNGENHWFDAPRTHWAWMRIFRRP